MAGNATVDTVAKWLVVVGALNWGVAGVGGLLKNASLEKGVVAILPAMVANIVYLVVGLAGLYTLLGMFKK
ncbi:MAG TPA: DUF378 domain-containing protein [Candidatus Diapherotrites archaeon]|uniref:DUF378 domain-containing protein n=1 Tax=Candidatus Iainarchaeum sp. TaxID=3101447 RepID=A0A7J4IZL1_9ARCH|nr:DUF378 domain-containing protein [Candidatus Diapherotrites archaeon]